MVRQAGFEPAASPLGGVRSIQLSYWRLMKARQSVRGTVIDDGTRGMTGMLNW